MTENVQQQETSNDVSPGNEDVVKQDSQPLLEKHKVKVNGKIHEFTIDDLKRSAVLELASRKRFDEAAEKFKAAEELKNTYSKKELDALFAAGWTEEELEEKAAQFLVKRAKEKTLTPEQRARLEKEMEYEKLKKEKIEREENEKNRLKREIEERDAKTYQNEFFKDVAKADKNTWLDLNDPIILQHIINDITLALEKHNYDMPVMDAVKRLEDKMIKRGSVKKEYLRNLLKNNIKDIDDSEIDAFLEKGAKGIREKSVEAIKRAESPFAKMTLQGKNITDSVNTPIKFDEDYYRKEFKKYRDLRYKRFNQS